MRRLWLRHDARLFGGSRNRRYRYYVCTTAQKRGWETCPVKSVPAYEVEQFVIERLRAAGRASESGMPVRN